ncbi:pilus assembly protein CpaF, partial [Burkholderia multivorans]
IVQIGRLSNGRRRILSITEVTGLSDNIISTQELYRYEARVTPEGEEVDHWESLGIHPHSPKLARFRQTLANSGFGDGGGFGGGFG